MYDTSTNWHQSYLTREPKLTRYFNFFSYFVLYKERFLFFLRFGMFLYRKENHKNLYKMRRNEVPGYRTADDIYEIPELILYALREIHAHLPAIPC